PCINPLLHWRRGLPSAGGASPPYKVLQCYTAWPACTKLRFEVLQNVLHFQSPQGLRLERRRKSSDTSARDPISLLFPTRFLHFQQSIQVCTRLVVFRFQPERFLELFNRRGQSPFTAQGDPKIESSSCVARFEFNGFDIFTNRVVNTPFVIECY